MSWLHLVLILLQQMFYWYECKGWNRRRSHKRLYWICSQSHSGSTITVWKTSETSNQNEQKWNTIQNQTRTKLRPNARFSCSIHDSRHSLCCSYYVKGSKLLMIISVSYFLLEKSSTVKLFSCVILFTER